MNLTQRLHLLLFTFAGLCLSTAPCAAQSPSLEEAIRPFWSGFDTADDPAVLHAEIDVEIDGKRHQIDGRFVRHDDASFDLRIDHDEYGFIVRRRADGTAFALPQHEIVFLGHGEVDPRDQLAPAGALDRLVSSGSSLSLYASMLQQADSAAAAFMLQNVLKLQHDGSSNAWTTGENGKLTIAKEGSHLEITAGTTTVHLSTEPATEPAALDAWGSWQPVELPREELERQLARGLRRTLEILAPSAQLTNPAAENRRVDNGELRWVSGQRLVLLHGSPEQIGQAHGALLREEAMRCIDSVLHAFGTVQTIRTGRWFRHELDQAFARLAPHIPQDHHRETRALAAALYVAPPLLDSVNVFPALFHCSGFAVFDSATADGKLYHGRVLDYMTTVGLQDAATTFIIAVDGKVPFANVGYAGFIGSVTGMNAAGISLGEMGGGGEGKWDGVPMATLMRRGLEECRTLEEVKSLWRDSPRTCEYYYVFADGKTNEAVGVAATPESIEFVAPGESHTLLGEGITDAVVLSAGDRLTCLRQRVQERHGEIDADLGQWLMSRPVAMQSNLHNALFVPSDGVFYVAHADHERPAAERAYVRYHLADLLQSMNLPVAASGE